MKRLTFLLLLMSTVGYSQLRFDSFNDLRSQKGTYASWAIVRYGTTMGDKMGGFFFWDSTGVAPDDNRKIIGSWNKGRYMKSEPLTMSRGTYTQPNLSLGLTTITIPHGLMYEPVNVQYSFKYSAPINLGSAWQADATNIYIRLNNPTLALTGVIISWIAYVD